MQARAQALRQEIRASELDARIAASLRQRPGDDDGASSGATHPPMPPLIPVPPPGAKGKGSASAAGSSSRDTLCQECNRPYIYYPDNPSSEFGYCPSCWLRPTPALWQNYQDRRKEEQAQADAFGSSGSGARLDRHAEQRPRFHGAAAKVPGFQGSSLGSLGLENVRVRIISFGTRTLAQCHPFCKPAESLHTAMWDRSLRKMYVYERNELFDASLARRAVCEVLASTERSLMVREENVHFVCCTILHDGAEHGGAVGKGRRGKGEAQGATMAHIGSHPDNMAAYMEQWQARRDLAPSVVKILEAISKRVHNHPEEDEEHVIATWCNAGEHRSVGIGEAILALAVALGMAVQGEDKVR